MQVISRTRGTARAFRQNFISSALPAFFSSPSLSLSTSLLVQECQKIPCFALDPGRAGGDLAHIEIFKRSSSCPEGVRSRHVVFWIKGHTPFFPSMPCCLDDDECLFDPDGEPTQTKKKRTRDNGMNKSLELWRMAFGGNAAPPAWHFQRLRFVPVSSFQAPASRLNHTRRTRHARRWGTREAMSPSGRRRNGKYAVDLDSY